MKQKLLPLLCVLAAAACAPNQDNTAQSAAASAVQTASAVPQAAGAWTADGALVRFVSKKNQHAAENG